MKNTKTNQAVEKQLFFDEGKKSLEKTAELSSKTPKTDTAQHQQDLPISSEWWTKAEQNTPTAHSALSIEEKVTKPIEDTSLHEKVQHLEKKVDAVETATDLAEIKKMKASIAGLYGRVMACESNISIVKSAPITCQKITDRFCEVNRDYEELLTRMNTLKILNIFFCLAIFITLISQRELLYAELSGCNDGAKLQRDIAQMQARLDQLSHKVDALKIIGYSINHPTLVGDGAKNASE